MKISEICDLEPKEFLEKVKGLPYSSKERKRDFHNFFILTIKDMVLGSYLQLKEFSEGFKVWKDIKRDKYYFLDSQTVKSLCLKKKYRKHEAKLFHIVNVTERLAQKMGVGQVKIGLWMGEESIDDFSIEYPCLFKFIGLDQEVLEFSDVEIEYLIAHELAHLQHNDPFKGDLLIGLTALVDFLATACAIRMGFAQTTHQKKLKQVIRVILVRMVIQGLAGSIIRKITVGMEKKADMKACQVLNSSEGMILSHYKDLKENLLLKYGKVHGLEKEEIRKIKSSTTPHGDDREDFEHPPLTQRLEYALNFKPRQGSLGS
jgi:hypothetical protein